MGFIFVRACVRASAHLRGGGGRVKRATGPYRKAAVVQECAVGEGCLFT